MSTEVNNVHSVEDDNKLVTKEDLQQKTDEETNLWSDQSLLDKLNEEMNKLAKVRLPVKQLPELVLIKAMAEVLSELEWSDYTSFRNSINRILTSRPPNTVPFSIKTVDQRTNKKDFWVIRVFIDIGDKFYEVEESDGTISKFSKLTVLMSHQFCSYFRDYCRTQLNDEAQFWTFTGSYRNKQHLDMSKINERDMAILKQRGETNPNNLVMFQIKKKTPEVYLGSKSD